MGNENKHLIEENKDKNAVLANIDHGFDKINQHWNRQGRIWIL